MKKTNCFAAVLAALVMVFAASCGGSGAKDKKQANPAAAQADKGLSIAFVDLDSLMAHYQYYLDCSQLLEKKSASINNTLNAKGLALQKEMAEFQDKIQKKTITEEQALKIQTSLQNKQTQIQNLQQNLTEEFQKEQNKYNTALHDSVNNFLQSYNKTAGYTLILARSNDNILLADPKCDITEDVIEGLNKRYKAK
jgi:outer membrane protein